jgi:dihydrodipicolinate synthase/N-acetylneuraminate lyase
LLVLTGTDSTLLINLENKGGGCITAPANLISPNLRRIWDAYKTGDDVTPLQAYVTRIRNILEKYTPFPPILKALLARQYGLPYWTVRPPLEVVPLETLEKVAEELLAASG